MNKDCYSCKFAVEARNLPRTGEQVRCARAEELFGGERWVDVRKGKKGQLLQAKCGEFQSFQGSEDRHPEPPKPTVLCDKCDGKGQKKVKFVNEYKYVKCPKCDGVGKVESDV